MYALYSFKQSDHHHKAVLSNSKYICFSTTPEQDLSVNIFTCTYYWRKKIKGKENIKEYIIKYLFVFIKHIKCLKCLNGIGEHTQNQSKKYSSEITEVQRGQTSHCRYHSVVQQLLVQARMCLGR